MGQSAKSGGFEIEALALARMAEDGWVEGAIVDGPLTLDVALSSETARIKRVESPVAGNADILIVPGVVAGNTAAKAIQYLAGGRMAGLVEGAKAPITINSCTDTADTRLLSTALLWCWQRVDTGTGDGNTETSVRI